MNRAYSNTIISGLLLLGFVLACSSGYETEKANLLVAQGNSAIEEGKKYFKEAEEQKEKMLHTDVSQLAQARTIAGEAVHLYDQAEAKAKESAAKFEEASKLKLADVFKQYLELKVKEYNKRGELIATARDIPQALLESQDRASFLSRANAATEKGNKLNQEANDLSEQADKLQKDNPATFKN